MAYIIDRLVLICTRSNVTFDIGLHGICVRVGGRTLGFQFLLAIGRRARKLRQYERGTFSFFFKSQSPINCQPSLRDPVYLHSL